MKKGLVHMDWIISFSIFLLYIVFIFIFLKPIRVESSGGNQVLDLVEEGVREQVYWNVTRVPLFIDCNGCSGQDEICLDSFPFDWQDNDMRLLDENGNDIGFDNSGCQNPDVGVSGEFSFSDNFESGQNVYWVMNAPGDNSIVNSGWTCTSNPCSYMSEGASSNEYVYSFGLPEFISGVSGERFRDFDSLTYNNAKTMFRLPAGSEFGVELLDVNRNSLISYINVQPGNDNVYVREWGDRLLFNDSTSNPVIIRIQAF